ncbi:uncharacterized protein LOC123315469 isoform X1 [Coccinella septempunctata]|uniref:uncharacterized protein LOC123315469 isoform X1 n=1 Tax=Coccinella septempunctata TaxID=41139 RepID=UPI001D0958A8|nr:uncharacterized protein LOC123315469 isoform X1 [Coccinella septempunctata]XP_044757097.1 uncharacterized protein LOC123315469 isoform X1 [Coccinella septempunctata]XP_044757098.1 uncharacterized protein LOC123315469 isoform X1 [Coccinella septempunctata]
MLDLDEEERIQESLDILDTAITQQKRIFFNDMANYSPKASIPIKERMKRFLYNNLNSDDEYLMEVKRKSLLMEKHSNYTILNDAVKMNDSRYVEALIKSGAPLDNPDRNQMTPLEIAISTNNYELCAMLLYYGCSRFRSRFSSHLIYAICTGSNPDIQLLLLKYEPNLNVCFLKASLLFVAIKHSHFLIPHLLNCGVHVDFQKTFYFILRNPVPLDYFQLFWKKFDYDEWEEDCYESVLLAALKSKSPSNNLWQGYLRIIIEDPRIGCILERHDTILIPFLVDQYCRRNIPESKYYDLICILLSHGCRMNFEVMDRVLYFYLGWESPTYKLLRHMEIIGLDKKYYYRSFGLIQFCFQKPLASILHSFFNSKGSTTSPDFEDFEKFFTVTGALRKCLESGNLPSTDEDCSERTVPPLLELARNRSRDFICMKYKIVNAGKYISVVKHYLNLPDKLKTILTFDCPLY